MLAQSEKLKPFTAAPTSSEHLPINYQLLLQNFIRNHRQRSGNKHGHAN
jgi:hypothetical protein